MAQRVPVGRSAPRLVVALPLVLLAGCTGGPQACTEMGLVVSAVVDVRDLDIDPRSIGGLICVEDDCGPLDSSGSWPGGPDEGTVRRSGLGMIGSDEVEVRLVLTDPGTGAERYRGRGTVQVEFVEVNGPGCGETRDVPALVAGTDGTLRA